MPRLPARQRSPRHGTSRRSAVVERVRIGYGTSVGFSASTEFANTPLIRAHRAPYKDLPGQLLSWGLSQDRRSFWNARHPRVEGHRG